MLLSMFAAGCGRGDRPATPASAPAAPPNTRLPSYEFAPELASVAPEVRDFVRVFLETCYSGDYAGYRQLVARTVTPETQARFESMYHAIDAVRVETIDSVRLPGVDGEVFRVICDVRLNPDAKRAVRTPERKLAILVFREEGELRMAPAPPELQPHARPTTSQPEEESPEAEPYFPWDADKAAAGP